MMRRDGVSENKAITIVLQAGNGNGHSACGDKQNVRHLLTAAQGGCWTTLPITMTFEFPSRDHYGYQSDIGED